MNQPVNPPAATPAGPGQFLKLITTGQFLPWLVIPIVALCVVGMIGSIVVKSFVNHGFMPPATVLARFECPGPNGPFALFFRHGKEVVRIETGSGKLGGSILNGQIQWAGADQAKALIGFEPPQSILYDDTKKLRITAADHSQVECTLH